LIWTEALTSSGVAIGVGFLVGLERQLASSKSPDEWFGGVRTYAITALSGALLGILGPSIGWWLTVVGTLIVGALLFAPAILEHTTTDRQGMTSEVACTLVFVLGLVAALPFEGMTASERYRLVLASGVVAMGMLTMRNPLHKLAAAVSKEDLYATVKLALLIVVALPLLPDIGMGPGERINPWSTGLLVSLIAGIGFVGYIAVRVLGASRGMALTGLLGGLVSSTAVTLNFAGRVKNHPQLLSAGALGIVLGSAVMVPRVLVLVALVAPGLLDAALLPIGSMGMVAFILGGALFVFHRKSEDSSPDVELHNPFSLGQALKFGAVYIVVLLISGEALDSYGSGALLLTAALAGLPSVDAITLSVAALYNNGLESEQAVAALLVACTANTAVKIILATTLGSWKLGLRVMGIFIPMIIAGATALMFWGLS